MSAVVVGSTGLVGSHILSILLSHSKFTAVQAYSRRTLTVPDPSKKLTTIESQDSTAWPSKFPTSPTPGIFFSGLGTTKGQAGSVAAQRKIDYDLNLELAKAAKAAGVEVYVLISAAGASKSSMVPYSKMKGELEEEVGKIGFKHCVIVTPGLIIGNRQDSRPTEFILQKVAGALGVIGGGVLKNPWAQDADVIAKAAVSAGMQCLDGKRTEEGVWRVGQSDIVKFGKKEWVDASAGGSG